LTKIQPIDVNLGEGVLIHLNTGDVIGGNVAEKTEKGFRLADAFFVIKDKGTGKQRPEESRAAVLGLIEIPYSNVETLQVLSVGL